MAGLQIVVRRCVSCVSSWQLRLLPILLVSVQSALPVATDHSGNDRTQAGLCVNEQYQGQFSAARYKRITAAAPITCQMPKNKEGKAVHATRRKVSNRYCSLHRPMTIQKSAAFFSRKVSPGSDEYRALVIAWKKKPDDRICGISSGNQTAAYVSGPYVSSGPLCRHRATARGAQEHKG